MLLQSCSSEECGALKSIFLLGKVHRNELVEAHEIGNKPAPLYEGFVPPSLEHVDMAH